MPSKIQLDENLWFLYVCLQKSDYKNIDFSAVGEVTHLKPPAARMRYTRLRRQIESGTLIGTHGTPFQRAAEKGGERGRKRKRDAASDEYESDTPYERESDDETALAKRNARLRAATIEPRMPRQLIAPLQRSQEERKKKKEMPDSAGSESHGG